MFSYAQRNGHVNVFFDQEQDGVFVTMNVVGDPVRLRVATVKEREPLHLVVSVKKTSLRLWVNGRYEERTLPGLPFWGQGALIWGERQGYGMPWEGTVSHIRLIGPPARRAGRRAPAPEGAGTTGGLASPAPRPPAGPVARTQLQFLPRGHRALHQRAGRRRLPAGGDPLRGLPARDLRRLRLRHPQPQVNRDRPLETNKVYTLEVEPFDQQPQLRSELRSNDLEAIDLPAFLILP